MSRKLSPENARLKEAAEVAGDLSSHFGSLPSLCEEFEKHAPPATLERLTRAQNRLYTSMLDAAMAETEAEREQLAVKSFTAGIRFADLLLEALAKYDPTVEAGINDYFTRLAKHPRLNADYSETFEEAGAPVLAAMSRKARGGKPEAPKS